MSRKLHCTFCYKLHKALVFNVWLYQIETKLSIVIVADVAELVETMPIFVPSLCNLGELILSPLVFSLRLANLNNIYTPLDPEVISQYAKYGKCSQFSITSQ